VGKVLKGGREVEGEGGGRGIREKVGKSGEAERERYMERER
jgi:hypothetical protein